MVDKEIRKMNVKISLLIFIFVLLPLGGVIWLGGRVFLYDICSAKVNKVLTEKEQLKMYSPTEEEIISHPNLVAGGDQISGFYRGVLKCYRDAKQHYYLWY